MFTKECLDNGILEKKFRTMHEFLETVNQSWPNFNFVFLEMTENVKRYFWNFGNDIAHIVAGDAGVAVKGAIHVHPHAGLIQGTF